MYIYVYIYISFDRQTSRTCGHCGVVKFAGVQARKTVAVCWQTVIVCGCLSAFALTF